MSEAELIICGVGCLMEFLTALGQDVKITVKPTRKEQEEMEVVVSLGR